MINAGVMLLSLRARPKIIFTFKQLVCQPTFSLTDLKKNGSPLQNHI